jgi:four helix bundle protein
MYQLSRTVSQFAWTIYQEMDWPLRKTMGDQWITSIDSVGANIAEGFGRFHFLDKNRFNYNARGSLLEAIHWTELLKERSKITIDQYAILDDDLKLLHGKLNGYIKTTKVQSQK